MNNICDTVVFKLHLKLEAKLLVLFFKFWHMNMYERVAMHFKF